MALPVFLAGMTMGLSLIVAIGAQNAFVLRQGLKREHVLAVCLACALSDAALIVLGVTSFARIAALLPWLDPAMRFGGAAFLAWQPGLHDGGDALGQRRDGGGAAIHQHQDHGSAGVEHGLH